MTLTDARLLAWAACGLVAAASAGCKSRTSQAPEAADTIPTRAGPVRLRQVQLTGLKGMSGLTQASKGALWAVPERDRKLIKIVMSETGASVQTSLAIVGAPEGQDLESVAKLDDRTLLFGTETTTQRFGDRIVVGRLTDGEVRVESPPEWTLDYGPWAIKPGRNKGLEALCLAAGQVLAISETVKDWGGDRLAPAAVRGVTAEGLPQGRWRRYRLRLTSHDGKISAVTCRDGSEGAIDAVAIERHFGTMRLVRFTVPANEARPGAAAPTAPPLVDAEVLVDLGAAYDDKTPPPNYEGVHWVDERTLVLIADNDYGGAAGPTILLFVELPPDRQES